VRIGLFFSAAAMSGAFSGLLAAAIVQMDGVAGLTGWQWIFLLEGLFTVCFGAMAAFILPNTPHQAISLTTAQADIIVKRLETDVLAVESPKFNMKALLSTFKDLHIWLLSIALFCNGSALFGLAYFTPSIVQGLGYDSTKTQLLTVPPYAIAFVVTLVSAYMADRYKARGITAICTTLVALIGFAMFIEGETIPMRYTALCLMITGVYSSAPSLISWMPNNTAAHVRRATAVALGFILTNVGGIVSTWIYPKSAAPGYKFAAKFNLSMVCITIAVVGGEIWLLKWKNEQKEEDRDRLLSGMDHISVQEQFEILGDHHPDFKYTL
jgi:predicted MFS family arabinose efflux permease